MIAQLKSFCLKHSKALSIAGSAVAGLALSLPALAVDGLSTMVSDAGTQFSTTTGFTYADLVTKVGDWLKMFLGGGLGLVDALIGWIIALIIFGIIVSLIFKAMRFLHILR